MKMIRDRLRSFRKQEDFRKDRDETYKNVLGLLYYPDSEECEIRYILPGDQETGVMIDNVGSVISDMKMCVDTFIITPNNLEFTFKPRKTVNVHRDMVIIKFKK